MTQPHEFVARDGRLVQLRPVVKEDAAALIRAVDSVAREGVYFLRSRFETDVEKEEAFIANVAEQGNLFIVALLAGRLVGWVTLFRGRAEFIRHTAELGMGVVRGFRGNGIGTALMSHALKWAAEQGIEKVNLGVRASNERAIALYRKFGFVQEGYKVWDVKDQRGRYDDNLVMAYFVSQATSPPAAGSGGEA
jgi:RimJ/RimL family protein N-acetyltransferase